MTAATTPDVDALLVAERQLHAAQLAGDVDALDRLLDDRLVAIGPDGNRHTKHDDLAGYRSGSAVITELVEEQLEVLVAGTTGVTFFVGTVAGSFGGRPMSARLRYTRTWVHDPTGGGGSWPRTSPCCHRPADPGDVGDVGGADARR